MFLFLSVLCDSPGSSGRFANDKWERPNISLISAIDSDNSHHFCETENLTASSMLFYSMLSNTSCSSQVDCEVRICVIWLVIRAI